MTVAAAKIGELASIKGGKRLPKGRSVLDDPTQHPYLRVVDFCEDGIDRTAIKYIDDATFDRINRYVVQTNDVYISIAGTIGRVGIIPEDLSGANLTENAAKITDFDEALNPQYLMYYLRSHAGQADIQNRAGGTSQPKLALYKIADIDIPLRPLVEQHSIVSILASYDELIVNNRRRIQLLEEAARLLYKEWFVHLRFPGHEHVELVDGIPDGWEISPVSSFCTVGRGGSPRPIKDYLDGTVPWFKIGDATSSSSPFVFLTQQRIIERGVSKSVLLPPKELILSNSATCGIPYFTGISGCIHDGWLYFRDLSRVSKWFLYCGLYEKQREILMGIGEGATQKNLNTNYIGRQEFLVPIDQLLLTLFDEIVEPLFEQIFLVAQQNIQLAAARDVLLPNLMNGKIAV